MGREAKTAAKLSIFFSTCCACQKICYQTAQKTALCAPCEHPGGFGIRKSASNSGHSPVRGLGGGLGDASPARRGSRSRPPLRRPRPLRFERLPVPVWNPYSRGRLSPAKSEDRKGGEGKTDANLTIFFSTCCALGESSSPRPP